MRGDSKKQAKKISFSALKLVAAVVLVYGSVGVGYYLGTLHEPFGFMWFFTIELVFLFACIRDVEKRDHRAMGIRY